MYASICKSIKLHVYRQQRNAALLVKLLSCLPTIFCYRRMNFLSTDLRPMKKNKLLDLTDSKSEVRATELFASDKKKTYRKKTTAGNENFHFVTLWMICPDR